MSYISLYDGTHYDPFHEDPERAKIPSVEVFVHSLSLLNRYTGHTVRPYSVAEHTVRLATSPEVVSAGLERTAIIHDFVEALMNDIPRPYKSSMPEYTRLEEEMQEKIFGHYREPLENLRALATFDHAICVNEMQTLMLRPPIPWMTPLSIQIDRHEFHWAKWRYELINLCREFGVND